jgi:hypothetical protein
MIKEWKRCIKVLKSGRDRRRRKIRRASKRLERR